MSYNNKSTAEKRTFIESKYAIVLRIDLRKDEPIPCSKQQLGKYGLPC